MAKHIVIIGGGFSGLNLAKKLKSKEYVITLVDRNNYTFFPPLLYQVATGFLEPSNISYPYRKMFSKRTNLNFKLGELVKVMPESNNLILTTSELHYDYLVFATGTEANYFGIENVKTGSIPMKTINDALEMRNYILKQLEKATNFIYDPDKLKKTLNIVIAGGGPTGVEIAGMLAEMRKSVFRKDYPEFAKVPLRSHIYLVDGSPKLLSSMSQKSQDNTYKELEKLGVKIILNAQVTDYINDQVMLSNNQIIETENLIWAAGVTSQVFEGIGKEYYGRGRRLKVDPYNKVEGLENVYAIGDTCIQTSDIAFPDGHPQVAQVALQQSENVVKNFSNLIKNKPLNSFKYRDKGSMAIIGRNKAVADLPNKYHSTGFIAWLIWLFIHLISLVHYRNKITTLYNWVTSYFTKDQALRMIIRPRAKS